MPIMNMIARIISCVFDPDVSDMDVDAILTQKAAQNPEKLDWQHSIVDLLKLLGMDSSLFARENLARELRWTGDLDGSAEMNDWLHERVMDRLKRHRIHI